MKRKNLRRLAAIVTGISMVMSCFSLNPVWADDLCEEAVLAEGVSITRAAGYEEAAFVEFSPVEGADAYQVFVSKDGSSWGDAIDDELIRGYAGYLRADIPGLAPDSYFIKVSAVKKDGSGSVSSEVAFAVSEKVEVIGHDRSGFAFVNGKALGAYNGDGTLRDGAVVIYVNEANKDDLTADIITADNGKTTTCKGILEVLTALKKGKETRPVDIRIVGLVTDPSGISASAFGGDWVLATGGKDFGVTIEGIGRDSVAKGWGIRLNSAVNAEIRNLAFMNCDSNEGDDIGVESSNRYVWVHNCDLFYGEPGKDADQKKGDGAVDVKKSTNVTISYNHFWDNGKCNLLGLKENTEEDVCVTYHHNWYDHSDSRHPRVRFYTVHTYNNYFDGNSGYGIAVTSCGSVFAESNYFRNCHYPMLISMQGSDVFAGGKEYKAGNGSLSSECGGMIKAFGNVMEGKCTYIPYHLGEGGKYLKAGTETAFDLEGTSQSLDFDAYETMDRDEKVPETVKVNQGAAIDEVTNYGYDSAMKGKGAEHAAAFSYNNFDTAETMYEYTADSAADAREKVMAHAGRAEGGDLKYEFKVSDDFDGAVNSGLKSAMNSYEPGVRTAGSVNAQTLPFGNKKQIFNAEEFLDSLGAFSSSKPYGDFKNGSASNGLATMYVASEEKGDYTYGYGDYFTLKGWKIPSATTSTVGLVLDTESIDKCGTLSIKLPENATLTVKGRTDKSGNVAYVRLLDAEGKRCECASTLEQISGADIGVLKYNLTQAGTYTFGFDPFQTSTGEIRLSEVIFEYAEDAKFSPGEDGGEDGGEGGKDTAEALLTAEIKCGEKTYQLSYPASVTYTGKKLTLPADKVLIDGVAAGSVSGDFVLSKIKYKNNKNAGTADMLPVFKPAPGVKDKAVKQAVKTLNKELKAAPLHFTIAPADLSAMDVKGIFVNKNGKWTYKLTGTLAGKTVKLKYNKDEKKTDFVPAAEYDAAVTSINITGRNNFTGTAVVNK